MKYNILYHLKQTVVALTLIAGVSSCDYLDVIPDNLPTIDHAFQDRAAAEKSLFTCYSRLPRPAQPWEDPAMLGSDEMYAYQGPDQMTRDLIGLITGKQSTDNGNMLYNKYKDFYTGIRDCNTFLEKIHEPYDLTLEESVRWTAEVNFLKAYYHFCLFRMYGAIVIADKNLEVSVDPEAMRQYREPVDVCVNYIDSLLVLAAKNLPDVIEKPTTELGRITRPIALAVRAKLWVTAASPLFNGNTDYANIIDNKGRTLFPQTVDPKKWEKAKNACSEAIQSAEAAGCALYHMAVDPVTLNDEMRQELELRMILFDKWNSETIWGATNADPYWMASLTMPQLNTDLDGSYSARSMFVPTLDVVETYYTKNGVPIDEDPEFAYDNRYEVRQATSNEKWQIREGEYTARLHFDREPRFYASIGFDRGMWFGNGRTNVNDYNSLYYTPMRKGEACGIKQHFYSATGYFCKKLHDYRTIADKNNFTYEQVPFPAIRLADLYLLYAEARNEVLGAPDDSVYLYVDRIRERAHLKGVVESWAQHSVNSSKPTSQTGMREIIHQERMIELAMEGQRFWDIRRWKEASDYFNRPIRGWNIKGTTMADFYNITLIEKRSFNKKDYVWPYSTQELINNPSLEQNYGW